MFQKSLLKKFIYSFDIPNSSELFRFVTKDKFIAEDSNGAEFILLLAKFLQWFHCDREVKNSTDSKKADGIVYDNKNNALAIIELKSSDKNIADRDTIAQAFGYKNEKPTCKYVIISNFKQLDIYCESSDVAYKLDLTKNDSYSVLYALLNQNSLQLNEIKRLKNNSKSQEQITKEVYKEYSAYRLKLLNNLLANNQSISKEEILFCTNKLLDRFMFILFAGDRGLIPANSIDSIIKQFEQNEQWGEHTPLYDYYKKYFHFIDVGNETLDIPKYNGNLFKLDELLESLVIDDEVIKSDLSHLGNYDFSDDVDVEVLGHIFEQSLNDLEKIKESILTQHTITNTRKKDGVFYTPKFVTKYIIKNTVGKLCEDKKQELTLYDKPSTIKQKNAKKQQLQEYKTYLENLKIIDPSCGSGAFLTACFRYLLKEHKWLQSELTRYGAHLFDFHNLDKQIIENNLFGVDINSASVGIAKLGLWLQTAKRGRPLSDLMRNILQANSLTSDWNELFPEIMANGGFDCVIGNPPYVRQESIKELKPQLQDKYSVFVGTADLFLYFYELAFNILQSDGLNGFICSNKFFRAKYGEKLREMILNKMTIESIRDFSGVKVFEDATVDSAITILQKQKSQNNSLQVSLEKQKETFTMKQKDLSVEAFSLVSLKALEIKKKIETVGVPLKEWDIKIFRGILTGLNEAFIIDGIKKDELIKLDSKNAEIIKPLLRERNLQYFISPSTSEYLIVPHNNPPVDIEQYPTIKEYLNAYYQKLETRQDQGATPYNLRNCAYLNDFLQDKIVYPEFSSSSLFSIDKKGSYLLDTSWFINSGDKFLLACLNSKAVWFYLNLAVSTLGTSALRLKKIFIEKLPIPKISKKSQEPFIALADKIITTKEKIAKYKKHYDSLNAVEKIEIKEELEKMEKTVEESTNKIDTMVYELYELTSEEIRVVESSK